MIKGPPQRMLEAGRQITKKWIGRGQAALGAVGHGGRVSAVNGWVGVCVMLRIVGLIDS